MTPLIERVAEFIARHDMFRPGHRLGVGVSGGADSVFLLHALRELSSRWNLQISVVHLEHGIRGTASLADAEFVANLAQASGLPFHLRQENVPASGGNLEQAARRARIAFFDSLIRTGKLDRIATGHTRSDQAETVLYRVLRGSGLSGLAAILPVTSQGLVRPLLEVSRDEIEAWLRERAIEWREDETNQDLSFARNRIRHQVLPLLRESFNPRLETALANLATLAEGEERYWQAELDRAEPALSGGEPLVISASKLASLPAAVARRLIRRLIQRAKGDLRRIDFAHIEAILQLARSEQGRGRVQLPSVSVTRSFDWLRFRELASTAPLADFSLRLAAPGSVELPGAGSRITLQMLEKSPEHGYATVVNELDWDLLRPRLGAHPGLAVRNWRPGDQYRRVGRSKPQKIKILLQEARVPVWDRGRWPIITYNGVILWARHFGAAADFAAGPSTRLVLRVDESGEGSSDRTNCLDRLIG